MKKVRFIPLFALTALLSGCSLFGGGAGKTPKFDKEGDEVKYAKFTEALTEAYQDSELYDTDSKLGDRVIKSSTSYSESRTVKRGKKEVNKSTGTQTYKAESQFDYGNLTGKETAERKYTEKSTTQEGSGSSTSNEKLEYHYQFEKVDGTKSLVMANAKTKEYRSYQSVPSSKDEEDVFDSMVRSSISYVSYVFEAYLPSSSSAAEDYLFYNNNDLIFTYSYNDETSDKSDYYNVETTSKIKAQVDLTDKKQACRLSYEVTTVYTYKKDYNGYLEDDVVTSESKRYAEFTVNSKDVNLKAVDIDDYSLVNSGGYIY